MIQQDESSTGKLETDVKIRIQRNMQKEMKERNQGRGRFERSEIREERNAISEQEK